MHLSNEVLIVLVKTFYVPFIVYFIEYLYLIDAKHTYSEVIKYIY